MAMTQEQFVKEQIEAYIDQLDLLKMQDILDQNRYQAIVTRTVQLIHQYYDILREQAEKKIEEVESRFVVTVEEEYLKRQEILSIVQDKKSCLENIFLDANHAPELREQVHGLFTDLEQEIQFYQADVDLVMQQLVAIKEADDRESELSLDRLKLTLEISMMRNAERSYQELDREISAKYQAFIEESKPEQIDLSKIIQEKGILEQRQAQLLDTLNLARSTKDAEGYVKTYEGRLANVKLEIDRLEEQIFIRVASKVMSHKVTSYSSLEKRTKTLETLINKRKDAVSKLYKEGVVRAEEYETVAATFDHSEINRQLADLKSMEQKRVRIKELDKIIDHLRDSIKGKEELESIFHEKSMASGRKNVGVPVPPKEESIVEVVPEEFDGLDDSYEGYQSLTSEEVKIDLAQRQKVQKVEEAKPGLLKRLAKLKKLLCMALVIPSLFTALNGMISEAQAQQIVEDDSTQIEKFVREDSFVASNVPTQIEETSLEDTIETHYDPSIGDQIHLDDGAKIYSTAENASRGENGYEITVNNFGIDSLYVARGAILDSHGNLLYSTSEYGTDLAEVATSMGLDSGTYSISLGCALGDQNGDFIPVRQDTLNPNIEKGWVNASDPNLIMISQLNKQIEKGGISR